MKETLYAAERGFLERYLFIKSAAALEDVKTAAGLSGRLKAPGSAESVGGIYRAEGGAAHITVEGFLTPQGPDLLDLLFGFTGTAYSTVQAAMNRAREDPSVEKVVLHINSPGGALEGADETWQAHKALAAEKPTEVRAGSLLASAAYWIAAPAGKILAVSPASEIGSIGVLAAVCDTSGLQEKTGVRKITVTSSKAPDKAPDIKTEEGRGAVRAQLDALERVFYSRVSEGRKVSDGHIAEKFGKGGLLIAADPDPLKNDAIRSGMIDGLASESAGFNSPSQKTGFSAAGAAGTHKEERQMNTLSEFLAANPSARADLEALKEEARKEGRAEAKAEFSASVERIAPVMASAAYPPSIKAIAGEALAGKKSMEAFDAAVAVFDAQKEREASKSAREETEENGGAAPEPPDVKPSGGKEFDAAASAELASRRVKCK